MPTFILVLQPLITPALDLWLPDLSTFHLFPTITAPTKATTCTLFQLCVVEFAIISTFLRFSFQPQFPCLFVFQFRHCCSVLDGGHRPRSSRRTVSYTTTTHHHRLWQRLVSKSRSCLCLQGKSSRFSFLKAQNSRPLCRLHPLSRSLLARWHTKPDSNPARTFP